MTKDNRFRVVKVLIDTGEISTFQGMFTYIPKRVVYESLGLNYSRFQRLFASPDLFSLRELVTLAGLIGCEPSVLFALALAKPSVKKRTRKK